MNLKRFKSFVTLNFLMEDSENIPRQEYFEVYFIRRPSGEGVVLNPPPDYLNQEDVEVVSKKRIVIHIVEAITVGKSKRLRSKLMRIIYGIRIEDEDYLSPIFHLVVKKRQNLKDELIGAVKHYLGVRGVI